MRAPVEVGAVPADGARTRFAVWAPGRERVGLCVAGTDQVLDLPARGGGYFGGVVDGCGVGTRYRYLLDDEGPFADPASRSQPEGVHGPSEVVDLRAHRWADAAHRPRPPGEHVIYEVHVGAFTVDGTLDAGISALDDLVEVGVSAVELMPVAQFPGTRNWGYDGVFPFAVQSSYGGAAGLQRFVDACHLRGLDVILDVVYNHLGPEGNVLGTFGPYFTDRYRTPWGPAVNFDGPASDDVRAYFVQNACQWFSEYHIDGLRLDAVHEIIDRTARPFLAELADAVGDLGDRLGRRGYLVAESADNNPRVVTPTGAGGYGMDAQWNDDFHHALHASITGERSGYYADFGPVEDIATAMDEGFVFQGGFSAFRGRNHGAPSRHIAAERLVVYAQNHDQIGNRARGDRLCTLVTVAQARLATALVLLAPGVPMLFMGEEYADPAPFPYFIDHGDPALVAAVRAGRALEFAEQARTGGMLDAADPSTFHAARLDRSLRDVGDHRARWVLHRALISLRRANPALRRSPLGAARAWANSDVVTLVRSQPLDAVVALFNVSADPAETLLPAAPAGWPGAGGGQCWTRLLDGGSPELGGGGAMFPAAAAPGDVVRLGPWDFCAYHLAHDAREGDQVDRGGAVRIWPGSPHPLGATWDGQGVNFALFSENAREVQLCLFDHATAAEPTATVSLSERTDNVFHVYLPDVRPGTPYGYRVDGPYEPEKGHRFNASKLLIDPYAKAVSGPIRWSDELFGYTIGDPQEDLSFDARDSAGAMPKCLVVDPAFTWEDDRSPNTPWNKTVIYETHVRGMTVQHPGVPEHLRGTYLGLASDPVIDHLLGLGVTAVELMPVHHFAADRALVDRGLTNYWGYNSIAFLAPHVGYATGGIGQQVSEFKSMVRTLHRAGLEVILDVVYNHTGEGNQMGPTLSLRGIDNSVYYRLMPDQPRFHLDYTGTGNSLNILHPRAMGLVTDSLRYWVTDMHVDGFRFDLAPVLVRGYEAGQPSAFFEIIQQDPVLSKVKLIAEPWDASPDGYQLGQFPTGWSEWNGAFRDCVRRFWRGDPGQVPELASRLTGSSDIYAPSGRRTYASINFVTCHDGFTLTDLVSYDDKHNMANGEDNRDGAEDNASRNWGAEGPTESARIQRSRDRMKRNFLTTLLFAQGVPMLLGGDEIGRTQQGNNNAYCQDSEVSWFDWVIGESGYDMYNFVRDLIAIMQSNPILRRRGFFTGTAAPGMHAKDVTWIRSNGQEMTEEAWSDPNNQSIGMLLLGSAADEVDSRGRSAPGDTLLLLLNAGSRSHSYTLPRLEEPGRWEELLNTARPGPWARQVRNDAVNLTAHSSLLLRHTERLEG